MQDWAIRILTISSNCMTVDEYLQGVPVGMRQALERLRRTIRAAAPNAEEVVTYRIPFYKQDGMLVGFSAARKHCTFHIVSAALLRKHAKELAGYVLGRGSIQFTPERPVSAALVTTFVKARLAENRAHAAKRSMRSR